MEYGSGTVRLPGLALRRARRLADRYGITIPQLIDALLIEYEQGLPSVDEVFAASPAVSQTQRQRSGRVIDLERARERRRPA